MIDIGEIERESRRLEQKRKGDTEQEGRRKKRRKLPKLEGWGEEEEGPCEIRQESRQENFDFQKDTELVRGPVEISQKNAKHLWS